MSQQLNTLLRDKAWARWTALILLAAAMFFAYIFVDILSPLQASLQSLKGWDPSAYGHYTGSEMLLNVFVLFLIFGGVIREIHCHSFRLRDASRSLCQLLCSY